MIDRRHQTGLVAKGANGMQLITANSTELVAADANKTRLIAADANGTQWILLWTTKEVIFASKIFKTIKLYVCSTQLKKKNLNSYLF